MGIPDAHKVNFDVLAISLFEASAKFKPFIVRPLVHLICERDLLSIVAW